jgi:glycerate kinase
MKIIVAPDSFKGSLSAAQAAAAIAEGMRSVHADADIIVVPLADGGEGTVDALVTATKGRFVDCDVLGPLGQVVHARFGFSGIKKRTAFIEMAAASGITLVDKSELAPLLASTYGTGQLILAALEAGADEIVIGLGGSATNDGGAGAMQALGVRFLDDDGNSLPCPIGGGHLDRLARIDMSGFKFPINDVRVTVASDVTNPFIGPNGASAVYGPQKGATPEIVARLDAALGNYAQVIERILDESIYDLPGAGAAGGLGGSLTAFLKATMASGIDIVLDAANFNICVADADLVITGEGRIDGQTLQGKTISGVMKRTQAYSEARVVAFGGSVDESARQALLAQGLSEAISVSPAGMSIEEAMATAATLLTAAAANYARSLTKE